MTDYPREFTLIYPREFTPIANSEAIHMPIGWYVPELKGLCDDIEPFTAAIPADKPGIAMDWAQKAVLDATRGCRKVTQWSQNIGDAHGVDQLYRAVSVWTVSHLIACDMGATLFHIRCLDDVDVAETLAEIAARDSLIHARSSPSDITGRYSLGDTDQYVHAAEIQRVTVQRNAELVRTPA